MQLAYSVLKLWRSVHDLFVQHKCIHSTQLLFSALRCVTIRVMTAEEIGKGFLLQCFCAHNMKATKHWKDAIDHFLSVERKLTKIFRKKNLHQLSDIFSIS